MAIVRNIDVTMQSQVSFDDACRGAVTEAAKLCVALCLSRSVKWNAWSSMTKSSHIV